MEEKALELTILLPCLNEEETLGACIDMAQAFLVENNVAGEVLVADNASTDSSVSIARAHGARVVNVTERGYGAALRGGHAAARGRYVAFADADGSYDLYHLMPFLTKLREGNDLVMGNRFAGGIEKGAMSPLHRYVGNPFLSAVGRVLYHNNLGDYHCGLRAYRHEAIESLALSSSGMEYASEMVVKASLEGLRIAEVPTTLVPDGRSGKPHLRTFHDGWRHLKLLWAYRPR